jgi:hypothetical protein
VLTVSATYVGEAVGWTPTNILISTLEQFQNGYTFAVGALLLFARMDVAIEDLTAVLPPMSRTEAERVAARKPLTNYLAQRR